MTRRRNVFLGMTALALAALQSASATAQPTIPTDVKDNVRLRVKNGSSTGIVVGLIDVHGTTYFHHGTLSHQSRQPVNENTIFEIGSITKVFTSLLLARLVEHGTVDFDDPIGKHLPARVNAPTRNGKRITLNDLATHRSGLPRLPSNLDPADPANPYADYSADQLYDFLSGHTLGRDIGSKYEYSNLAAGLLGHILARKAGKTYEQLVIETICKPLGMSDTGITLSEDQLRRLAKGHAGDEQVPNWDFDALSGAGALRASAKDMLTFLAANMELKKTDLSPAMKRTRRKRYATGSPDLSIALAWHITIKFETEIILHNGGTGGYRSFCGFVPKKKLGVVVLANSTESIDDVGLHLLEPKYELQEAQEAAVAKNIDPETLKPYAGYYELSPGVIFHITAKGDQLSAQLTGQPKAKIYPESETKFFYKIVNAQITFVKGDDGNVTSLIIHQNGNHTARKLGPDYQPSASRVAVPIKPTILKRYVGQYQLAPGAVFDITLRGDKLMAKLTGQTTLQIYPESETKFFYKAVDAQITFATDDDGMVTGLTLHQAGRDQFAKRK